MIIVTPQIIGEMKSGKWKIGNKALSIRSKEDDECFSNGGKWNVRFDCL
jgi:hypothetical protein